MNWILILEDGGSIDCTFKDEDNKDSTVWEEIFQEMESEILKGGMWFCENWVDLNVIYKEHHLTHINTNKVVGIIM